MPNPRRLAQRAASATAIAIPLYAVCLSVALASSGHAHHQQGGFDPGGILEVAGTAAALVILYMLATWFFRARDNGKLSLPGADLHPGPRSHVPDGVEADPVGRLPSSDSR